MYDHPDSVKMIADLQQVYVDRYGDVPDFVPEPLRRSHGLPDRAGALEATVAEARAITAATSGAITRTSTVARTRSRPRLRPLTRGLARRSRTTTAPTRRPA